MTSETNPKSIEIGSFPGMKEQIDWLETNRLGRTIAMRKVEPLTQSPKKQIRVGYCLPLNNEQTKHIILFEDGLIIVTEPQNTDDRFVSSYKEIFSPNELPYEMFGDADIPTAVDLIKHSNKVPYTNEMPSYKEIILSDLDKALKLSVEMLASRQQTKIETAQEAILRISRIPKTPPPNSLNNQT